MKLTIPGIKKYVKVILDDKASIDAAMQQVPDQIDCFFGVAAVTGKTNSYIQTVTVNFISYKYITDEYLTKRVKDGGAISYVSSAAGNRWKNFISTYKDIVEAKTWDEMVKATIAKEEKVLPGGAYFIAKRSLDYYVKTMVVPFGKRNIRINTVNPVYFSGGGTSPEFYEIVGGTLEGALSSFPCGVNFTATIEDVANGLLFLNSAMAKYISGVNLYIDYGNEAMIAIGEVSDFFDMSFIS